MFLFSPKRRLENEKLSVPLNHKVVKENAATVKWSLSHLYLIQSLLTDLSIFGSNLNFLPNSLLVFSTTFYPDSACVSKSCKWNPLRQRALRQAALVQHLNTSEQEILFPSPPYWSWTRSVSREVTKGVFLCDCFMRLGFILTHYSSETNYASVLCDV